MREQLVVVCPSVLAAALLFSPAGMLAQALPLLTAGNSTSATAAHAEPRDCGVLTLMSVENLSTKQRACFYTNQLIAPKFALTGAFVAGFGEFRNVPHIPHGDWDDVSRRFGIYYSRHTARDAAEFMVGYLHHEDPRFHKSASQSFWRRTNSALVSVLTSPDADGHLRPAYAPIAGSLTSAFVGSVMYRHTETVDDTLLHAGGAYGYCFLRAFVAEFRPEMNAYARHLLHHDKN